MTDQFARTEDQLAIQNLACKFTADRWPDGATESGSDGSYAFIIPTMG